MHVMFQLYLIDMLSSRCYLNQSFIAAANTKKYNFSIGKPPVQVWLVLINRTWLLQAVQCSAAYKVENGVY